MSPATYYRWKLRPEDCRKHAHHGGNLTRYSKAHEERVLSAVKSNPDLNADELIASCPDRVDEQGHPDGFYPGSRSYVCRVMRKAALINHFRAGGKGRRHNFNHKRLEASGPNQVRVWDITYLYSDVGGGYFYLYAVMDLYSRKMIHREVHNTQSDTLAAEFISTAVKKAGLKARRVKASPGVDFEMENGLILHYDNGGPMKGRNMMARLASPGITASYSRPRHSNDNAHMESSFATLRHCHSMPIPKVFTSVSEAQKWCDQFYSWYDFKHPHSGIAFLTPQQCCDGSGKQILEHRNQIIKAQCLDKGRARLYKLQERVSLMRAAIRRQQIERSVKNAEYAAGSKAVA